MVVVLMICAGVVMIPSTRGTKEEEEVWMGTRVRRLTVSPGLTVHDGTKPFPTPHHRAGRTQYHTLYK